MANLCFEVLKGAFSVVRHVLILTGVYLCLLIGVEAMSYAQSRTAHALMQEHIEKVKRTKPKKYRAVVERAGGKIKDCCSCHEALCKGKKRK